MSLGAASVLFAAIQVAALTPWTSSSAAAADPLPVIYNSGSDESTSEGDPGYVSRIFLRFGRSGDLSAESAVKLTLVDGTAKRGGDYSASAYTKILKFPAGEDFVYFYVNIRTDFVVEPDETFSWHLSDPVGATIRSDSADGSVVIRNDDSAAPSTFSVGDTYGVAENNFSTSPAEFTVGRSGSLATAAWVRITTVDATAVAPGDYQKRSTTLFFPVGERYKEFLVPITNDVEPEPQETFSVQLSNPVHAAIADGTGVGTINDDDTTATPELGMFDSQTEEGDSYSHPMTFNIYRKGDLRGTSTVTYTTADGTAHAPADYVAKTGTVTFKPGDVYRSITLSIKGDNTQDQDPLKDFFVTLSDASAGTTIADSSGQIYIEDDDCPGVSVCQ
jgi:hypothetical protein